MVRQVNTIKSMILTDIKNAKTQSFNENKVIKKSGLINLGENSDYPVIEWLYYDFPTEDIFVNYPQAEDL